MSYTSEHYSAECKVYFLVGNGSNRSVIAGVTRNLVTQQRVNCCFMNYANEHGNLYLRVLFHFCIHGLRGTLMTASPTIRAICWDCLRSCTARVRPCPTFSFLPTVLYAVLCSTYSKQSNRLPIFYPVLWKARLPAARLSIRRAYRMRLH